MTPKVKALTLAHTMIETHGWCRGTFVNRRGHYCLRGAINAAARPSLRLPVTAELAATIGVPLSQISAWHDHPKRTKRQVLRVITRTIKRLS